jgi:serine protease Do
MIPRARLAAALAVGVLSLGNACGEQWDDEATRPPPPPPATHAERAGTPAAPVVPGETCAPLSFSSTVEKVKDAVVNISTAQVVTGGCPFGICGPFKGRRRVREGLGSGFVLDAKKGLVVTNNHVIDGANEIIVQLADRREFPAGVLGRDKPLDLAILQIPEPATAQLALGDSDDLRVGDWVIAIGNPIGLSHTVTAGVVSAVGRSGWDMRGELPGYADFIQTDASINPGNSGGPLLSIDGEVVGINTAVIRGTKGVDVQGIGFAIPVEMLTAVKDQLIEDGRLTRSWMGILVAPVDDAVAKKLDMSAPRGALVGDVVAGGPADAAGLLPNDVILEFGDEEIEDGRRLPWVISMTRPGTEVEVEILRDGKILTKEVVLVPMPERL